MNKNLTEIVFILDRSGSMSGLESDTIGGFNAMIEKQKKAPGEALVSTILFDNVSEVIHDRVNIRDIKPMTDIFPSDVQPLRTMKWPLDVKWPFVMSATTNLPSASASMIRCGSEAVQPSTLRLHACAAPGIKER